MMVTIGSGITQKPLSYASHLNCTPVGRASDSIKDPHNNWYPYTLKIGLNKAAFMVVHLQTKDDNWNFSSAKFETFGNLV